MKKRVDLIEAVILFLIIFSLIAIFVEGRGPNNTIIALISVSTFLFGILGAFIMQNRHKRLDELRKTLRIDDALYINIYRLSELFGKDKQKKVQEKIDNFYIKTIDYKLIDYCNASKAFLALFDFLKNLKFKGAKQQKAYERILNTIMRANENRKYTEYLTRNKMMKFKWVVLIGLQIVILFGVFYINDNSPAYGILAVILSTSSMLFLLILRDLDTLIWKEQKWIWDPLEQVFQELDLIPYYPEPVISSKRVILKKGVKRRIVYYPHPYPNFSGKKVKIEN